MFRTLRAAAALLLCLFGAAVQGQALTFRHILDRKDVPQPDHKIVYGTQALQYGELWLPTTPGPHPVVVLIHGGCWRADLPGPELVAFLAAALRSRGAAVWSLTYRRVGHEGGGYPGTFLDVAKGVDHLRELAGKHVLDLTRVVATGHSAGGHLALWAAARGKVADSSPLQTAAPLPITSVVPLAGVPDLAYASAAIAHACGDGTVKLLVDEAQRGASSWQDTSPVALLPLGVKQILVSATYDGIIAPAHAWRYQQRALDQGDTASLITLENAGHFELIAPWTAAGSRVVDILLEAAGPGAK